MAEELCALYQRLQNQTATNEEIKEVTQGIEEIKSNPESINIVIQTFELTDSLFVKNQAAFSLKHMIRNFWDDEYYPNEGLKSQIKSAYMNFLTTTTNTNTRHHLLDSMIPMLRTELGEWPELLEFILGLSGDPEYYFSALATSFEYLPLQAIGESFESLCEIIQYVLGGTDLNAIKACAELLTELFRFLSTDSEMMEPLFDSIVHAIEEASKTTAPYLIHLVNAVSNIFEFSTPFADPEDMLVPFLELMQTDELPVSARCLLLEPVGVCAKRFTSNVIDYFPDLIEVIIAMATECIVNDCFEQQKDSLFVVGTLESICISMPPNDFFNEFWSKISLDSNESTAAAVIGLHSFIEYIPEVVSLHFHDIIELAVSCMNTDHHMLQEAGVAIVMEIISRCSSPLSEFAEDILEALLGLFNGELHEPLVMGALSLLVTFLYIVPVPVTVLTELFDKIVAFTTDLPSNYTHLTVRAIAAFVQAAGGLASDYIETLLPLVLEAAQADSSENAELHAAGIEALSAIIKNAPLETTEIHEAAAEAFVAAATQGGTIEDLELFGSAMIAFKDVVGLHSDVINQQIAESIPAVLSILNIETDEVEEDLNITSATIEARELAVKFLAETVKSAPLLIFDILPVLLKICGRLVHSPDEAIQNASLKLSGRVAARINGYPKTLIRHLIELLRDKSLVAAAAGFRGLSKLVKKGVALDGEVEGSDEDEDVNEGEEEDYLSNLEKTLRAGFICLSGQLACQRGATTHGQCDDDIECDDGDDEEDEQNCQNIDLRDDTYGFFAAVAQYIPRAFPLDEFWKRTEAFKERESTEDYIECIGVLAEYVAVSYANIPTVYRTAIIEAFIESLSLVNFEVPPHPVSAMRVVAEVAGLSEEAMGAVTEVASTVLESEFEGEFYFWPTVAATVSLLFSLFRSNTLPSPEEFLPRMLQLAQKCLVEAEAENIVSALIFVAQRNPEAIQECHDEVEAAVIESLTFKVRKSLSEETASGAEQLLATLRR